MEKNQKTKFNYQINSKSKKSIIKFKEHVKPNRFLFVWFFGICFCDLIVPASGMVFAFCYFRFMRLRTFIQGLFFPLRVVEVIKMKLRAFEIWRLSVFKLLNPIHKITYLPIGNYSPIERNFGCLQTFLPEKFFGTFRSISLSIL